MKKEKSILLLIVIVFCSCTVHNWCGHLSIPISNNSGKIIYEVWQPSFSIHSDTIIDPLLDNPVLFSSRKILPGQINSSIIETNVNTYCFGFSTDDSLAGMNVWFFDSTMLATTSWDTIKAKGLYLKRLQLNYSGIKSLGWKITYP